jgi:hypothetical protein
MTTRRSGLGPTVMTLLSIVVMAQTAALAWLLLVSPDRHRVRADLMRNPIPALIDVCTAPFPQPADRGAYGF